MLNALGLFMNPSTTNVDGYKWHAPKMTLPPAPVSTVWDWYLHTPKPTVAVWANLDAEAKDTNPHPNSAAQHSRNAVAAGSRL